jgi:hypothetical protein
MKKVLNEEKKKHNFQETFDTHSMSKEREKVLRREKKFMGVEF